jgi:RNA polymerase subunit RPABC4/transcription elongation factor Spt4
VRIAPVLQYEYLGKLMSDLFASLWTPEVQMACTIALALLVVLYVLSVLWTARDAYLRGTIWPVWTIVALIPIAGVVAYCFLRPPLYRIDQDEQELEIALKQRELKKYGECGNCGYPVEADYVLCPNCHTRLKNMCPNCHRALDPHWQVCPYCATQVAGGRRRQRPRPQQTGQTSRQARPEQNA